jgi:hypothetical protein
LTDALDFAGQTQKMSGFRMQERSFTLELHQTPQVYGLVGWLALNGDNYRKWKSAATPEDRTGVLNQALTGHLRVWAKAMGDEHLEEIWGRVIRVDNQKRIRWHGAHLVRFHALIESTIALPYGIGLGRSAAFGFGEVLSVSDYERLIQRLSHRVSVG